MTLRSLLHSLEVNIIIIAACLPTLRPIFKNLFDGFQIRLSITRKSHTRDGHSYELQPVATKTVRPANKPSREAPCGWQNENGSQINIVPINRDLEVRELDMRLEDRGKDGVEKDEEYGWSGTRAAMSASTVF